MRTGQGRECMPRSASLRLARPCSALLAGCRAGSLAQRWARDSMPNPVLPLSCPCNPYAPTHCCTGLFVAACLFNLTAWLVVGWSKGTLPGILHAPRMQLLCLMLALTALTQSGSQLFRCALLCCCIAGRGAAVQPACGHPASGCPPPGSLAGLLPASPTSPIMTPLCSPLPLAHAPAARGSRQCL